MASRPEVDAARIGVTGNSGGGTHSAYLGALDDRLAVIAPSCYLTNWRRLLETIGPQDAEQCVPNSIAEGLDLPDFVLAAAPKPYMMLVAIRDFFSISGARETFTEVERIYDSVGEAARFTKFEWDDGHGYSLPRRAKRRIDGSADGCRIRKTRLQKPRSRCWMNGTYGVRGKGKWRLGFARRTRRFSI